MERLSIEYYDVIKRLIEIGRWPFRVEKIVFNMECFETVRYGEVCKEDGYIKVVYEGEEVPITMSCKQLSYINVVGSGTHEHHSKYLCRLEIESVYGIRTDGYIEPELAEFIIEINGIDYVYTYKLNKILWIYDAKKRRIIVLPSGVVG